VPPGSEQAQSGGTRINVKVVRDAQIMTASNQS
jgi:hypothetical protein